MIQKLSIMLSVFGVVLIFVMQGAGFGLANAAGISLLVLSCFASAGYAVLSRFLLRSFAPTEVTSSMMAIGCVTFWTLSLTGHAAEGTINQMFTPLANADFSWSVLYRGFSHRSRRPSRPVMRYPSRKLPRSASSRIYPPSSRSQPEQLPSGKA